MLEGNDDVTLSPFSTVSVVDFEQVNVSWVASAYIRNYQRNHVWKHWKIVLIDSATPGFNHIITCSRFAIAKFAESSGFFR